MLRVVFLLTGTTSFFAGFDYQADCVTYWFMVDFDFEKKLSSENFQQG